MNKYWSTFITIFLFAASVYPAPSMADNRNRNTNFLLTLGRAFLEFDGEKDEMTSLKVGGGYRLSPYIGFEVFYMYYGEISEKVDPNTTGSIKLNAYILNLVGIVPLGAYFDFYAKVGASKWKFKIDSNNTTIGSADGADAVFTTGLGYKIDYDSTIRLEFEASEYDDLKVKVLSFGFQHNF